MGNSKLAGIAAEDIGKVAYGIFKGGQQYVGKTVGITGENLTLNEMSDKLAKGLGIGSVKYNAVDADAYRGFGFPGADEMGNSKLAGIAAEDIGKVAYGIFKSGQQYVGKTVGITGENLTLNEMSDKLAKGLGLGNVKYNAVDADVYRGFGFPGADEMGNMFQVYRDFEKEVLSARSADVARKLNPQLQTFDQWLAKNKSKIPL